MKQLWYSALALLFFASCYKEELPVAPYEAGDVLTAEIEMEEDYKWQVYFDLKTNKMVGKNLKTEWDLAFETTPNGYAVILNSAKSMFAYNTLSTNFSETFKISDYSGSRKWDNPNGNLDATAIGDWRNNNHVYLIDRGYNEQGQQLGFRKIQLLQVDGEKYIIKVAALNGENEVTYTVNKNAGYNFTFVSFNNDKAESIQVEPAKNTWDLAFTQYTYIFYNSEPPTPYLVTGCLLNRYNTVAVADTTIAFENIDLEYAINKTYTNNIDAIGYNWKEYDFDANSYLVYSNINYIIKDAEGSYYKLHFIDFYNRQGKKGYPTFEFQRL